MENKKNTVTEAETKIKLVLVIETPQIEVQPDHEPKNKLSEN